MYHQIFILVDLATFCLVKSIEAKHIHCVLSSKIIMYSDFIVCIFTKCLQFNANWMKLLLTIKTATNKNLIPQTRLPSNMFICLLLASFLMPGRVLSVEQLRSLIFLSIYVVTTINLVRWGIRLCHCLFSIYFLNECSFNIQMKNQHIFLSFPIKFDDKTK